MHGLHKSHDLKKLHGYDEKMVMYVCMYRSNVLYLTYGHDPTTSGILTNVKTTNPVMYTLIHNIS